MYDFTLQKIRDNWPYEDIPEGFHVPPLITNKTIWVSPLYKETCSRVDEDEIGKDSSVSQISNNWCGFVEANLEKV